MRFPCPKCKALVRPGATVCHSCQHPTNTTFEPQEEPHRNKQPPVVSDSSSSNFSAPEPTSITPERKCPFCAEIIKAEAIKCRFCGSDLADGKAFKGTSRKSLKIDKRLIAGAAALSLTALIAWMIVGHKPQIAAKSADNEHAESGSNKARSVPTSVSITGSAFLNNAGGDSQILRGLTVVLCKPEALSSLPVDTGPYLKKASSIASAGVDAFYGLQRRIDDRVEPLAIATTKTNIDGPIQI